MAESLVFCTDCGEKNELHNQFCTVCGVSLPKSGGIHMDESSLVASENVSDEDSAESTKQKFTLSKRGGLVAVAVAVLVSFVLGVALTSENVFKGVIGVRYTEKRLENEKEQSYTIGYNAGNARGKIDGEAVGYENGYQQGNSVGYALGKTDGCNAVFDKVGGDQLIAIFYPYNAFNLGKYYSTRSDTC